MLLEFSLNNFKSFKNKTTFSMEKGVGDELENNYFSTSVGDVLKVASMFGPNASGKSNFMRAFTAAIMMVRNSNINQPGTKNVYYDPFAFENKTDKKDDLIEFEFIILIDSVKYIYSFAYDETKIVSEKLVAYYSQKPTTVFARENVNEYKFITEDQKQLTEILKKNTDNKLFLSTATNWNYSKTKPVFDWFMEGIDTYSSFEHLPNTPSDSLMSYKRDDKDLKEFALKVLKEADFQITDYSIKVHEVQVDAARIGGPAGVLVPIQQLEVQMKHEIENENGEIQEYSLNLLKESNGTQNIFHLIPKLKRAFDCNRVLVVDEIEKSLHPSIIEYIIKLFNDKEINKYNSQLIFSTHNLLLLNSNKLRRDQYWFADKDYKTGISEIYSLDEFKIRKDDRRLKNYLNGRYGAIPYIDLGD